MEGHIAAARLQADVQHHGPGVKKPSSDFDPQQEGESLISTPTCDGSEMECLDDAEGSGEPLTPDAAANVVKQIEFYFSDASLPTDKKLLKQIRKDPLGWVPVKMFANFRKVRAITRDPAAISTALRSSTQLVLSEDGKQVRRLVPVPAEFNVEDIQKRVVVVENLPVGSTIESVTKLMKPYGDVKLVRICNKETKGKLPTWLTASLGSLVLQHSNSLSQPNSPVVGGEQKPPHAYVEYATEDEAVMAVAALHDTEGWRPHGVNVHHLIYASSDTPTHVRAAQLRVAAGLTTRGSVPHESSRLKHGGNGSGGSFTGKRGAHAMASGPASWHARSHLGGQDSISTLGSGSSSNLESSLPVGRAGSFDISLVHHSAAQWAADQKGQEQAAPGTPGRKAYVPPALRGGEGSGRSGTTSPVAPSSPMRGATTGATTPQGSPRRGGAPAATRTGSLLANSSSFAGGMSSLRSEAPEYLPPAAAGSAVAVVDDDMVIKPRELSLKPIRTGVSPKSAAPANAPSSGGGTSASHAAAAAAAAAPVAPLMVDPAVIAAALAPRLETAGSSGEVSTSSADASSVPSRASSSAPKHLSLLQLQQQHASQLEPRSSGGSSAPKFVLDLPSGTRQPTTRSSSRAPSAAASPHAAAAASFAGLQAFGSVIINQSSSVILDPAAVQFQPLSPSAAGAEAAFNPFSSSQAVSEARAITQKLLPGPTAQAHPPAPRAAAAPKAPAAVDAAGADASSAAVQQYQKQLSRVSEGGELSKAPSGQLPMKAVRDALACLPRTSSGSPTEAASSSIPPPSSSTTAGGNDVAVLPTSPKRISIPAGAAAASTGSAQGEPRALSTSPGDRWESGAQQQQSGLGSRLSAPRPPRHSGGLSQRLSVGAVEGAAGEGSKPAATGTSAGEGSKPAATGTLRPHQSIPLPQSKSAGGVAGEDQSDGDSDAEAGPDASSAAQPGGTPGSTGKRRRRRGSRAGSRRNSVSSTTATPDGSTLQARPSSGGGAAPLRKRNSGGGAGGDAMGQSPPDHHSGGTRREDGGKERRRSARRSSKDYAAWAAATPEYRAEATAKYGGANSVDTPPRSPLRGAALSDGGGAIGSPPVAHHTQHVVVALGPDGTRGFAPRGRGSHLAPPPPA